MEAVQSPRLWLGETLIKICEKRLVGQVKQTGGCVGHAIFGARNVVFKRNITVEALMHGLMAQDGSSGRSGGNRTAPCPIKSCEVVRVGQDRALTQIKTMCGDVVMPQAAQEFELRVIHAAVWIGEGDEAVLHVFRERGAPQDGAWGGDRVPMTFAVVFVDLNSDGASDGRGLR
jgi:hypothetical protein